MWTCCNLSVKTQTDTIPSGFKEGGNHSKFKLISILNTNVVLDFLLLKYFHIMARTLQFREKFIQIIL